MHSSSKSKILAAGKGIITRFFRCYLSEIACRGEMENVGCPAIYILLKRILVPRYPP
jgi:hypothetical protein